MTSWSKWRNDSAPYLLKCKEKSTGYHNEHHGKIKYAVISRHYNPSIAVKLVSPWKNFPIAIWHYGCVLLYSHGGFCRSEPARTNAASPQGKISHYQHLSPCAEVHEQAQLVKFHLKQPIICLSSYPSGTKCLRVSGATPRIRSACLNEPAI